MKLVEINHNDGRTKIYFYGKKILSFKWETEFDKIFARRFDGLTNEEIKYCIVKQFKNNHGVYPNIENPKTFNEKLTWEKLYYRNPLMTKCADKVKAREYFCEKVENGEQYLVKQYGVYDSPDEIDFDALPNSFVLKSNWGSGKQFVVKDKATFDADKAKKEMEGWILKESNQYYSSFEQSYKDIVPKIVCEEFLDFEYKLEFFCFNGEPRFFWIVLNDKTSEVQANFYDLNWQNLHITNHYPNFEQEIEKPACYETILENARKMCGDFPFVRCDFYVTKDSYKFSEMTFFHWGCSQPYEPVEWDRKIGDMMKLPEKESTNV